MDIHTIMSYNQPGSSNHQPSHHIPSVINPLTREGMEGGYIRSPMAWLIMEYSTQQSEESQSTEFRVKYYSNFDLTSDDVQDLGFECFSDTPHYSLQPPLMETVVATVMELQTALTSAASLLIERSTIYLVDPQQMYI